MKLSEFFIYHIRIPFKISFGHAAARHTCSDSVVVRLLANDGTVGLGESAPREYVTGETAESVFGEIESAGILNSEACRPLRASRPGGRSAGPLL